MTINTLGATAHDINVSNGWDSFIPEHWPAAGPDRDAVRFLCTHMALVHSEVSEATEAIRARDRENFDEELADVVIRVASIAHGLGIDLDTVIAAKLAKNRTRGLHHGGKAV